MTHPSPQGTPCWYELGTTDLDAAGRFYQSVIGWTVGDSGMPGMDYRLAGIGQAKVAGMMSTSEQEGPPPPNWTLYFAVDDCDATAAKVTAQKGSVCVPPTDIPGVGRFAILADPQGAVFAVLTPSGTPGPDDGQAFNPAGAGHGQWHELMTSDPKAAMTFYGNLFGWKPTDVFPMGPAGDYQLFAHHGNNIGGIMGLGGASDPAWLPYFGVPSAQAAVTAIQQGGGTVINGPMEVPGPAEIVAALDPQGACFAVVAPKAA